MKIRKNSLCTLAFTAALGAAFLAPGASALDTGGPVVDDGDTGVEDDGDCPHIGTRPVAARIGATGAIIPCGGTIKLQLEGHGFSGGLEWQGQGCPSFLQVIPAHDKQVHKAGYRIIGTTWVNRINFKYECYDSWLPFDQHCKFLGTSPAGPPALHSYEAPCPWGN